MRHDSVTEWLGDGLEIRWALPFKPPRCCNYTYQAKRAPREYKLGERVSGVTDGSEGLSEVTCPLVGHTKPTARGFEPLRAKPMNF